METCKSVKVEVSEILWADIVYMCVYVCVFVHTFFI